MFFCIQSQRNSFFQTIIKTYQLTVLATKSRRTLTSITTIIIKTNSIIQAGVILTFININLTSGSSITEMVLKLNKTYIFLIIISDRSYIDFKDVEFNI